MAPLPVDIVESGDAFATHSSLPDFALLAERAVAMTHSRVGTASRGFDEAAVALLDQFLLENPQSWIRADPYDRFTMLAPAFGALVGEAMVYELGGAWIPGRHPLTHGVRVGDQIFLPALRAALATDLVQGDYFGDPLKAHSLADLFMLAKRARDGVRIPCAGPIATREALARFAPPASEQLSLAEARVSVVHFDSQGMLWTGDGDDVTGWDIASGQSVRRLPWNGFVKGIARIDDEVMTVDASGTFRAWSLSTGARTEKVGVGSAEPYSFTASGDLACWAQSKNVCVFCRGERSVRVLKGHSSHVTSVAITDDEIISLASEKKIRRWSRHDFSVLPAMPMGKTQAIHVVASLKTVAVLFKDGRVVLYPEGLGGEPIDVGSFGSAGIMFAATGRLVVSVDRDLIEFGHDGSELRRLRVNADLTDPGFFRVDPTLRCALHVPRGGKNRIVSTSSAARR